MYICNPEKLFLNRSAQWFSMPLSTDTNFPLQSIYQYYLNPQTGFWTNPGSVRISNNQSKSDSQ